MATFKSYFIGFVISLALTLGAYFAVINHWPYALVIILLFAIAQLFVQMFFFLHLNHGEDKVWNLAAFFSAFGIIFILVVGSLWIMGHLNYNMDLHQAEKNIVEHERIHK